MDFLYWLIPAILIVVGAAFLLGQIGRGQVAQIEHARQLFHANRAQLQILFFEIAGASGKPRGLRWKECMWSDLIEWVRDKKTGELMALAGVTIAFEAIEGGDMEGVEAVGNLRNASAVFVYVDGKWGTEGRVVFNLNPDEAVEHFKGGYERLSD